MKKCSLMMLAAVMFCFLTSSALAAVDIEAYYGDATYLKDYVFLSPHSNSAFASGKTVNGVKPISLNNRTLIPVRFVAEAFGGKVDWDSKTNKVTVALDGKTIEMGVNKKNITVNDVAKTAEIAPRIFQDTTYLPLRTLGDALGKVTVYDEATDVIIIRNPNAEPFEYKDSSLADIKWLLQEQPVIYMDDSYVFLDRGKGLSVWDRSRRVEQRLDDKDGFISPPTVVDGVDYYMIYTDEPTVGCNSLYAVQGKQVKLLMQADIADFQIYKDDLYLLTDEFADYFSAPDHTTYGGNLYWLPLKEANGDWWKAKPLGMPGYLYGFQVELIHYDHDTLMVWQRIGECHWPITDQGIEAMGVDLRTTSPEKTLGLYQIPLHASWHEKLRDLTASEFTILKE